MKNDLILVQWTDSFGGLEKISQTIEERFAWFNPLVLVLRPVENGLIYKNSYKLKQKNNIFFILKYFLFIRRNKNSIIHIQYSGTTILLLTYLAGARKIVFHFHGTLLPGFSSFIWKLLEKKITVIANSAHTEKIIRQKLKAECSINIIPNIINLEQFRYSDRSYNGGKFLITFAGRFDKGKNVGLILDAARIIKDKTDQIEFRLYGDGPEKNNIENKIRDNSLEKTVKLFPYTKEILKVYQESNIFLFVSLYESFGNVVAEAILTGLPVICYKIPSLSEFINDDIFFVNEPQPELIAEKIFDFKKNYETINGRLYKVNMHIREFLNNDKIASKLESIYTSLSRK